MPTPERNILGVAPIRGDVNSNEHQGPNSAYAAGPLGGRITLDGNRAATGFAPLEVGAAAPVAM
uniref:hypothetical protein n=1 Tax=Nocardia amamiensis TaxID=404578 RepID=UPI000837587E|nr:hypothetical protein [Nocardia amamiensis]